MRTAAALCLSYCLASPAALAWAPHGQPFKRALERGRGEVVSLRYRDRVPEISGNDLLRSRVVLHDPVLVADGVVVVEKRPLALTTKATKRTATAPSQNTLVALGCLLAANSGFLNGLTLQGILGNNMACAAVTGAWTNSALKLGTGNLAGFGTTVGVIVAYALGSFWNGLRRPSGSVDWAVTDRTLLGVATLVLAGCQWQSLPLLAMANGLQNSWTSMLIKGNVLRTAHFSGVTSDLGTMLGQIVQLKRAGRQEEAAPLVWKAQTQLKVVFSFFFGGLLSVACANLFASATTGLLASVTVYLAAFGALRARHLEPKRALLNLAGPTLQQMQPALRKPLLHL